MKIYNILALLLVLLSTSSKADVTIEFRGSEINYDDGPRLSDVVARLMLNNPVYWHNAGLYDLLSSDAKSKKQSLIAEIETLKSNTGIKTSKWAALEKLHNDLKSWQVADRLPLSVDYDLLRLREELNPLLDDGKYLLSLPLRKYTVEVFGAVEKNSVLVHRPTEHVATYLDDQSVTLLDYADSEYVYVIHRNGTVKKVSLGLHSREHVEVPPDGFIYIPIRELPFDSTNKFINTNIAQLAGNRRP